ncbi:MAG: flagellar hook-basal body complex protein FliE [Azospirillum sp.]|nr:flagellar hook-basal body complex protein FliE [Azospirillum sp.]
MVSNIANAAAAYANTAARGTGGMAPREIPDASFSSMLEKAARTAIDSVKASEQVSAQAAIGKADLTDVVAAVNNADVMLQTVTTVRDRIVSAYQEILRMPI